MESRTKRHGVLVVEERAETVFGRVDLDAGHVFEAGNHTLGAALDNHLPELLRIMESPFDVYRDLKLYALFVRRPADHAGGGLNVLAADGGHDFVGGQAAFRDLPGVYPNAHRVVARAEELDSANALDLC
jgi:hypothetical protein